jgi:hypothetical protein
MNWADEPATETQLSRLGHLGCKPGYLLTKAEALQLITWLEHHHRPNPAAPEQASARPKPAPEAYLLRLAVASVKRAAASGPPANNQAPVVELEQAVARRQEFWMDTCREATQMRLASTQVLELYQQHGCRFSTPKPAEAQQILDALDSAMPSWELNHPALFYQTLELNFPELVRVH